MKHGLRKSTVSNWIQKSAPGGSRNPIDEFTCEDWTPPASFDRVLIPYYVRDVPEGIPREKYPAGADVGPLTWAIKHVQDHPEDGRLTLDELPTFIPAEVIEAYSPRVATDGAIRTSRLSKGMNRA